jgi:hypothetical protein
MEIELTQGLKTVIDDEDFPLVSGFKWCASRDRHGFVYARCGGGTRAKQPSLLLHRLLMGSPKGLVVDHIDHDTLNNRRSNLRVCTPAENLHNSRIKRTSSSGIRNVMYELCGDGISRRWRAEIMVKGVRHRRYFDDAQSAEAWALETRQRLHGSFFYDEAKDTRLGVNTNDNPLDKSDTTSMP